MWCMILALFQNLVSRLIAYIDSILLVTEPMKTFDINININIFVDKFGVSKK